MHMKHALSIVTRIRQDESWKTWNKQNRCVSNQQIAGLPLTGGSLFPWPCVAALAESRRHDADGIFYWSPGRVLLQPCRRVLICVHLLRLGRHERALPAQGYYPGEGAGFGR